MTQQPTYYRYLETAKQADLAEQLGAEGYSVEFDSRVEDVEFDLIATRDSHKAAYTFMAGRSERTSRSALARLQQVARRHGFEFHIVVVNPPPRVHVEVDSLADQLKICLPSGVFQLNSLPSSHMFRSSELGTSKSPTSGSGKAPIQVAGRGEVRVGVRESCDSKEPPDNEDWLWFDFRVNLTADARISAVEQLAIDISTIEG